MRTTTFINQNPIPESIVNMSNRIPEIPEMFIQIPSAVGGDFEPVTQTDIFPDISMPGAATSGDSSQSILSGNVPEPQQDMFTILSNAVPSFAGVSSMPEFPEIPMPGDITSGNSSSSSTYLDGNMPIGSSAFNMGSGSSDGSPAINIPEIPPALLHFIDNSDDTGSGDAPEGQSIIQSMLEHIPEYLNCGDVQDGNDGGLLSGVFGPVGKMMEMAGGEDESHDVNKKFGMPANPGLFSGRASSADIVEDNNVSVMNAANTINTSFEVGSVAINEAGSTGDSDDFKRAVCDVIEGLCENEFRAGAGLKS